MIVSFTNEEILRTSRTALVQMMQRVTSIDASAAVVIKNKGEVLNAPRGTNDALAQ